MQNLRKIVECKNFAQIYLCINMASSCAWFLKFWFEFYWQTLEYNAVNTNVQHIHHTWQIKTFMQNMFTMRVPGGLFRSCTLN